MNPAFSVSGWVNFRRAKVGHFSTSVDIGEALGAGTCVELTAASLDVENSFEQPRNIFPVTGELPAYTPTCTHEFPKFSVTVLRWKKKSLWN